MRKDQVPYLISKCVMSGSCLTTTIALLDSWPGLKDHANTLSSVPPGKHLNVMAVPPGATALCQPLDVYFFRLFKRYIRRMHENAVHIKPEFSRFSGDNILKVLIQTCQKFCARRFRECFMYAWFAASYRFTPRTVYNISELLGQRRSRITSDDLFSLSKPPGKTLVVGASYVALECAGFLAELGFSVDLLIRSKPLKSFDQDCVKFVMENLKNHVNVLYAKEVNELQREMDKTKVKFSDSSTDVYDTVVWAMGRDPQSHDLNLAGAGVETDRSSGRIVVAEDDRTSAQDVYAIGDIALGRPELTPTAIRAGQLLAQRLFGGGSQLMAYDTVPTTVFTPLEFGTIGLTEERASEQFGADAIEVYHSHFTPFEYVIPQDPSAAQCYAKVICLRSAPRKVLGMHLVGPNAAEIIQGYAVAMKVGVTFDQLTGMEFLFMMLGLFQRLVWEEELLTPSQSSDQSRPGNADLI
ncbi:unnamed protein product [Nippostrongylus brasiliensis]|uniref:Probable glutathione reductase 2 (inferred by orthology to a C. elegans protein) n=1 Tax=Nippostrongylus brasiliensis TaxID=27835 RepID=A0A0N4YX11_NIPBR|nr:unnamed protein product [Nippostrongylus brasiliensis]